MLIEFEVLSELFNIAFINPEFVQSLRYITKYNSADPSLLEKDYTVITMKDSYYCVEMPINEVAKKLNKWRSKS